MDKAETGFLSYTRYFRSADGTLPKPPALLGEHYGNVLTVAVPGDSGIWALSLGVSGRDRALRALREPNAWHRAVALLPHVAHWAEEGEPITGVLAMSGMESRRRRYVVAGRPVATGVLSVGDAWATTNPLFGLGTSMGLLHAVALRDLLRTVAAHEAEKLALRFDEITQTMLAPIQESLAAWDEHRLLEIDGTISGTPYQTEDPRWAFRRALDVAKLRDPEILRAFADAASMLVPFEEAFAGGDLARRVIELGRSAPPGHETGPTRAELLNAIHAGGASTA
ncbi:hypothetical protein [Nonomuraea sp. NPDC049709]|uniref:hypothetical protein n=1 Tax=Nonomuraea sp. NPDC049709 TaxID=3154736 RepID=UPI00342E4326